MGPESKPLVVAQCSSLVAEDAPSPLAFPAAAVSADHDQLGPAPSAPFRERKSMVDVAWRSIVEGGVKQTKTEEKIKLGDFVVRRKTKCRKKKMRL